MSNNNQSNNTTHPSHKESSQNSDADTQKSSSTNRTSSSSYATTSSSAGTGTTASSADTVPNTQEAGDFSEDYCDQETPSWGILYPIDRNFYPLDLKDDEYTFGRGKQCQYSFDIPPIRATQNFRSYSTIHFTITRTRNGSASSYTVMINDKSMNGTFVNGERLPIKGSRQLCDKDEISMNVPHPKAFLFVDKNKEEDPNLPDEFKDKYIMHKIIGNGAFGEVREALSKFGTQRHAVKIINKQRTIFASRNPNSVNQDVLKEAKLLLTLHHPCVISVHDVIDSQRNLYIVLELATGGELFTRVAKGAFREPVAKLIFFQMVSAVAYLHDNNVTHRDLKPENILMMTEDEECLIKITDFGVSRLVGEQSFMRTQAGTPSYLAPEIVRSIRNQSFKGYTRQVDAWSLGVILYVCLVAYPPFAKDRPDTDLDLIDQIMQCKYDFKNSRWNRVSESAQDLITCLLMSDPQERFTPKQSLHHKWLDDKDMRMKAEKIMSSSEVERASQNERLLEQIGAQNRSTGMNIILRETELSLTSSKSDSSEPQNKGKRPHSTSSESSLEGPSGKKAFSKPAEGSRQGRKKHLD